MRDFPEVPNIRGVDPEWQAIRADKRAPKVPTIGGAAPRMAGERANKEGEKRRRPERYISVVVARTGHDDQLGNGKLMGRLSPKSNELRST